MGGKNGSKEDLLSRRNPEALCKRINVIHSFSKNIEVLNMDACKLVEEAYWMPEKTLFIDPQYFYKAEKLYNCYYEEDDHINLGILLESLFAGCPGADIIVTYDNAKFIEELYKYPLVKKVSRVYSI